MYFYPYLVKHNISFLMNVRSYEKILFLIIYEMNKHA